ncbi:serine/threonine-protein phosphatase 1 regulatory subunit 10-like [Lytechinus pictus]|uniref:serine/threonine-protein phosphatase 1 regulatory subunit 10-like n=1 Tax=Lytechinus pictus TaxID=7653 RepID=UPI0030B9F56D
MVKPSVFAIDPAQQKAAEKAKEAGQTEVPIPTDKLENELAVQTREGARGGCCSSLKRWQKITMGVVTALLLVGCIGFFTHRMLVRGGWCGNSYGGGHHRWDKFQADHGDEMRPPPPRNGSGGPGGNSEEHHLNRGPPGHSGENNDDHHGHHGGSSENEGHHGPPHHGHGPHHGPPGHSGENNDRPHGHGGSSEHGGPDHGPNPGPDHGPRDDDPMEDGTM